MRSLAAILGIILVMSLGTAAAAPKRLAFEVLRDGKAIGSHSVTIENLGGETKVDIATDVAVKFAFIALYRFEHEGHEVWRDGRLETLSSVTNDDGERHRLEAVATQDGYRLTADGAPRRTPRLPLGSLWRDDVAGATEILNTLDGSVMQVEVKDLGEETILSTSGPLTARHFAIHGELERDVWYDGSGAMARLAFHGKDGSEIVYQRK